MVKIKFGSVQKKLQSLQHQLEGVGPLMRGSVVRIGTKNKHYYFSLNKEKKTKLIYLGDRRVELARQYSKNYKELLSIVEKMTILNMEIVKRSCK